MGAGQYEAWLLTVVSVAVGSGNGRCIFWYHIQRDLSLVNM